MTSVPGSLINSNLTKPINANMGTAIASAATVSIGAATGEYVHITGTTTITAFDTVQAGTERTVVFDGVLTLTNNANIVLPGAANITTAAGDVSCLCQFTCIVSYIICTIFRKYVLVECKFIFIICILIFITFLII